MFSEKNKMIIFQIKEPAMTEETDLACPTVTTICGGQVFEAPCTLFSLAPVLRDCIKFCENDPGTLDLARSTWRIMQMISRAPLAQLVTIVPNPPSP